MLHVRKRATICVIVGAALLLFSAGSAPGALQSVDAESASFEIPDDVRATMTPTAPVWRGFPLAPETATLGAGPQASVDEANTGGAATVASYFRYPCLSTWNPVTSALGGYVIGNCYQTWGLWTNGQVGLISDAGVNYWYWGGYVNGVFDGCGFIREDGLDFAHSTIPSGNGPCASATTLPGAFGLMFNCGPGSCDRPTKATMKSSGSGCQMYANVRPWVSGGAPTDPIQFVPNSNPTRLNWRYVTKYYHSGSRYVMVQDTSWPAGGSRWGFVPMSCMALLPYSGNGYWFP